MKVLVKQAVVTSGLVLAAALSADVVASANPSPQPSPITRLTNAVGKHATLNRAPTPSTNITDAEKGVFIRARQLQERAGG